MRSPLVILITLDRAMCIGPGQIKDIRIAVIIARMTVTSKVIYRSDHSSRLTAIPD